MKGLVNSIYYLVKPTIPQKIRLELRRILVKRIMKKRSLLWPIDPDSVEAPEGWQGWPGGKRFALVLTHDVETAKGLKNCRRLMEIEEALGFRSSFNLVAKDYEVSEEFRKELINRGFEIGIHGLTHKGNLFKSESLFKKQSQEINEYLKEWESVGFRSPSMFHDLKMIHHLDIEYDASTFDTDPFEPQPDEIRSIFPLWIYNEELKKGYVELPYTLPQDHLVFLIMGERKIDIWKKKLDWIVSKGGMALLIAHPDYMSFDESNHSDKYPAELYREFLIYVKEKYEGQYWNPLPKDLARFWKENYSKKTGLRRKLHIGMPVYSFYEFDNRVMRYAKTLSELGNEVEVFSLRLNNLPEEETLNNVKVHRLQTRQYKEKSDLSYMIRLTLFLLRSLYDVSKIQRKKGFDLLHVHSIPDFEVFSAVYAKYKGAKVILDIHDLVPELYLSKFNKSKKNLGYKTLLFLEKISCKFADHVIIPNHLWYEKLVSRGVKSEKCTVIMNYPDDGIFHPRQRKRQDDKFIMIYPGTLSYHQGLDIAVKAFSEVIKIFPRAEFHIYGDGNEKNNLMALINELNAEKNILIKELIPINEISNVMVEGDVGIVPKRNNEFAGEAFSTKILEFMAVGVPVIVSATKIDRYYFNDSVVRFFKPGDVEDLKRAIIELIENKDLRRKLAENALKFVEKYKWSANKKVYLEIVDKLTSKV